ncbi:MAG: YchJ family metal-binding protein [Sulfurimonas sp.]|nr:YchJ family metal-binding protein [Sulfurimonas sp.]MDQ7062009.1 YchJ family metal-binding protein [Sulfurimonas sp.]
MKTPKELMISRYEAFVKRDWTYIAHTSLHQTLEDLQDAPPIEWLKLEVLADDASSVEFKAYYKLHGNIELLHEKSNFVKVDGDFKYKDGEHFNSKIQRNEACPCGSGKKFKKCCEK